MSPKIISRIKHGSIWIPKFDQFLWGIAGLCASPIGSSTWRARTTKDCPVGTKFVSLCVCLWYGEHQYWNKHNQRISNNKDCQTQGINTPNFRSLPLSCGTMWNLFHFCQCKPRVSSHRKGPQEQQRSAVVAWLMRYPAKSVHCPNEAVDLPNQSLPSGNETC